MNVAPHIYVITFAPLAACLVLALAAGTWLVDCGVHEAVAKLPGWFRPRTRRADPPGPAAGKAVAYPTPGSTSADSPGAGPGVPASVLVGLAETALLCGRVQAAVRR